jgi:hypothetical protein
LQFAPQSDRIKTRIASAPMIYKGVDYTVAPTATPWVWKWQFRIGDEVKTGKTETKIERLAMRRAELQINRELLRSSRE